MIPLRDIVPSRTTPVVTISIIALNVLVFVYELSLGRAVDAFTLYYGLVPAAFSWTNVFTSMFLHGGFLHVAGNMLYCGFSATTSRIGWVTAAFWCSICCAGWRLPSHRRSRLRSPPSRWSARAAPLPA